LVDVVLSRLGTAGTIIRTRTAARLEEASRMAVLAGDGM
jgi:hypothetical protein